MAKPSNAMQRHGDRTLAIAQVGDKRIIDIEKEYLNTVDKSHRKAYGQFFTPEPIAHAMAAWIAARSPKRILDPAVGTGRLLDPILRMAPEAEIYGVDLDHGPLVFANKKFSNNKNVHLVQGDFLIDFPLENFDGITCNPPYVRHHLLQYVDEVFSPLKKEIPGISKSSNLYVLFLAGIMQRLNRGGRAAVLLPGDWMHANYGRALRSYLRDSRECTRMVYFTGAARPFEDALTTAVILFLERGSPNDALEVVIVDSEISDIDCKDLGMDALNVNNKKRVNQLAWNDLDPSNKWDTHLRGRDTRRPDNWISLAEIGRCRRGIATGANSYFHISDNLSKEAKLQVSSLTPCIGRAKDVKGLIFSLEDWSGLASDVPKWLLEMSNQEPQDRAYIEFGEKEGFHKRYLCAARPNWYEQEQVPPADIWVGVFGREGIRFIANECGLKNLTTFHGFYLTAIPTGIDTNLYTNALVAILNSTVVQQMGEQHQRQYGGGLQKMEPRDVMQIAIPDLRQFSIKELSALRDSMQLADGLYRDGIANWREPIDVVMEQSAL